MIYKGKNSQAWREIGNKKIYFRSEWEYRFAVYLEYLKRIGLVHDWQHEPKTFYFEGIKRGTTNYKPDFFVTFDDGKTTWYEVKGYMDAKSNTKIKRFNKYFPNEKLVIVDKKWFKRYGGFVKAILSRPLL